MSAVHQMLAAAGGRVRPVVTGGIMTEAGGYRIHTFTSSGVLEVVSGPVDVEYLVVGGGGGAYSSGNGEYFGWGGGGGGAGDFRTGSENISQGTYPVVIGAGGSGSTSGYINSSNGSQSSFNSLISIGGGGVDGEIDGNGKSGASGGGGCGWGTGDVFAGGGATGARP
ncbi:glycine-rich domain-containing protein [Magnetospirillum sp. 15-1]|uniref:glycine-rich domain-containing protein n=1 Tax=Magnetospirillum sp. 15-1 TaxID=1979370 RepID=UPI0011441919|nr:hypothetical protein [Magnetospirillum sp. 15-1]